MPLLALSTGHKIGLGLIAGAFILFALASSFLLPRWRPQYPGRGGLPFFIFATVALFAGMMVAVVFLAREPKEAQARVGAETTSGSSGATGATAGSTPPPPPPTTASTPATTNAGTPRALAVSESEFRITVAQTKLTEGRYQLTVANHGKIDHNLVVTGPNVSNLGTATIAAGKSTKLTLALSKGTYELYCSLPGHKQAGMDLKLTVG